MLEEQTARAAIHSADSDSAARSLVHTEKRSTPSGHAQVQVAGLVSDPMGSVPSVTCSVWNCQDVSSPCNLTWVLGTAAEGPTSQGYLHMAFWGRCGGQGEPETGESCQQPALGQQESRAICKPSLRKF